MGAVSDAGCPAGRVERIERRSYEAGELMEAYPPIFKDRNKKAVYSRVMASGTKPSGTLVYSRWRLTDLPERLPDSPRPGVELREDLFGYEPAPAGWVDWYLNFAHSNLFCAYGGRLLAQDELQVLEHPVLGSLREAECAGGREPLTVQNKRPTPVLVFGAERRCAIATDPRPDLGRPSGLYGNAFAAASLEAVEGVTKVLDPPTRTNIIAMEAPPGGSGVYSPPEVLYILSTACTGFVAAVQEGSGVSGGAHETRIHTGFWGCGAYGGNRVLMALLQLTAARVAGIDRLIFHGFDRAGGETFKEARRRFEEMAPPGALLQDTLQAIDAAQFRWGVGNGT